jgi:hypothetical protein
MVDGFEFLGDICPIHKGNTYLIEVPKTLNIGKLSRKVLLFLCDMGYNRGLASKNYVKRRKNSMLHRMRDTHKDFFYLILHRSYVLHTDKDGLIEGQKRLGDNEFLTLTLVDLIKIINEHNIKKYKESGRHFS